MWDTKRAAAVQVGQGWWGGGRAAACSRAAAASGLCGPSATASSLARAPLLHPQVARDAELREVLARLAAVLSEQLGGGGGGSGGELDDCVLAVKNSCFAPLLVHQLCTTSFQDMAARWAGRRLA